MIEQQSEDSKTQHLLLICDFEGQVVFCEGNSNFFGLTQKQLLGRKLTSLGFTIKTLYSLANVIYKKSEFKTQMCKIYAEAIDINQSIEATKSSLLDIFEVKKTEPCSLSQGNLSMRLMMQIGLIHVGFEDKQEIDTADSLSIFKTTEQNAEEISSDNESKQLILMVLHQHGQESMLNQNNYREIDCFLTRKGLQGKKMEDALSAQYDILEV